MCLFGSEALIRTTRASVKTWKQDDNDVNLIKGEKYT